MSASPKLSRSWLNVSLKFLPFADAATDTLPLSRLLRLSLFQVSVGMALAMLVGTLNRVMIVELKVPAALVAIMIALPLLFAPFRALIGFAQITTVRPWVGGAFRIFGWAPCCSLVVLPSCPLLCWSWVVWAKQLMHPTGRATWGRAWPFCW